MRLGTKLVLAIITGGVSLSGFGQGTFQNLDFEQASPMPIAGSPYYPYAVTPESALPGWTVTVPGPKPAGSGTFVLYNDESLGSPAVSLMSGGPFGLEPLQGSYSVLMQYFGPGSINLEPPTLSQTGLIPVNAQSINFLSSIDANGVVEVDGESIPLVPIAGGRLAGNISAWSGQTAQLTFTTAPVYGDSSFYFDDIQFSPNGVTTPEPEPLVLIGIGGVLFTLYRRFAPKPQ
jgi:hypothetical protein